MYLFNEGDLMIQFDVYEKFITVNDPPAHYIIQKTIISSFHKRTCMPKTIKGLHNEQVSTYTDTSCQTDFTHLLSLVLII